MQSAEPEVAPGVNAQVLGATDAQKALRNADRHGELDRARCPGGLAPQLILHPDQNFTMPMPGCCFLVQQFCRQAFGERTDQLLLQPMRCLHAY